MTTTAILLAMLTVAPPERPLEAVASPALALAAVGPGAPCARDAISARGSARFVLVDSAGRRPMEYADANLVFCRTTSASMVWIRFADSPANEGNDRPHLDIDVCHLGAGGVFAPMEARARPCPGGQTWAAWWHDDSGSVYANRASSPACALHLEVDGAELHGTFSCQGLVTEDGTRSVDVLEGSFVCTREADPVDQGAHSRGLP